jgi:hypothetical protein
MRRRLALLGRKARPDQVAGGVPGRRRKLLLRDARLPVHVAQRLFVVRVVRVVRVGSVRLGWVVWSWIGSVVVSEVFFAFVKRTFVFLRVRGRRLLFFFFGISAVYVAREF